MENGARGEARTRALLVERFWVLERSVDIDGADYLIQRRLTSKTFLDRDPPRLGVVQVKYAEEQGTTHYVHRHYVCDSHGAPFGEFFLLVHTGGEDAQRLFLLSAHDIMGTFNVVPSGAADQRDRYAIPMTALVKDGRFEVRQPSQALNRIEHALKIADFLRNRTFLSAAVGRYMKVEPDHIDYDYTVDLVNEYCDIRQTFFELKERVQSLIWNLEEPIEILQKVIRLTDPLEARALIEQLDVNGYGRLSFDARDLLDEDFFTAVANHKAKLKRLREMGLEESFLGLQAAFGKWAISDLAPRMPIAKADAYSVVVRYNPRTLDDRRFKARLTPSPTVKDRGQTEIVGVDQPGHFEITAVVSRWGFGHFEKKLGYVFLDVDSVEDWRPILADWIWRIQRPLMLSIERHLFSEKKAK
jgi:hypothetical protein